MLTSAAVRMNCPLTSGPPLIPPPQPITFLPAGQLTPTHWGSTHRPSLQTRSPLHGNSRSPHGPVQTPWNDVAAGSLGSEVQDEITYDKPAQRFARTSNRAGGLEGGITNGEDVVVRGYLKPISTLRRALRTVDMVSKEPVQAAYERSDWCVVPAGAVAAEAMVALVLADAFLQKFGGDSLLEMRRNFEGYARQIHGF